MNRTAAMLIAVLIFFTLTVIEWPRIPSNKKKEKWAFVIYMASGTILSYILLVDPELPGPSHFIQFIFHPIVDWVNTWIKL